MIKYQVISAESLEELSVAVNTAAQRGWRPAGGIAVSVAHYQVEERDGGGWAAYYQYYQALTAPAL